MRPLIMAFDPGQNGGICVMSKTGRIIDLRKMPVEKFKKAKGANVKVDPLAVVNAILEFSSLTNTKVTVVIEDVKAIGPPVSRVSNFGLGEARAILVTAAVALRLPVVMVPPKDWLKRMLPGCGDKSDKQKHISLARQLWPEWAHMLQTKTTCDGLADAMLIAEDYRRTIRGAAR